ncbi:MAG: metalloregulator ArsR/SmtB family transcription factor [Acidimicrobiia bacterium]
MVELITPGETVRDPRSATRPIPIEIEDSVAFEMILAMWTTFNPNETNTSFELGTEWHDRIKELTPTDLAEEIVILGGPHLAVWFGVAGLLHTAPHPHDPSLMFDWLADIDPKRLRRWLISCASGCSDASLIEQAANGDPEALEEAFADDGHEDMMEQVIGLFEMPDKELPGRIARTLQRFRDEVFAEYEEDFGGAIERAAAARRAMANGDDVKSVIEEVTNGLDLDIPLGVTRVVLIPSVVTRPLSVIDQHRDSLLVYYGVADEFVDADPEAPPAWMVRTYKALSDERRLRILRRLREGDTSLDELTEMLGLSKSTVHHHMSILRAAGLIRIHVSTDKSSKKRIYSLRDQALEDASGFLDSYLNSTIRGVDHV